MIEIPDQPRPLDTREARRDAARVYAAVQTRADYEALTDAERAVILAEMRAVAACDDVYQPRAYRDSMRSLVRPGMAPEEHVTSAQATLDRLRLFALPPIDNTPAGRAARMLAATSDADARAVLGGLPAATIADMQQVCDINGWAYPVAGWKRDRHVAHLVERARLARIHEAARSGDASALYREYEAARRAADRADARPPTRPDFRPRVEVFRGRRLRTCKGSMAGLVTTSVNGLVVSSDAYTYTSDAAGLDRAAEQLRRDVMAADERRITDPAAYPAGWFTGAPAPDPAVVAWCQYTAKRERADRAAIAAPDQVPAPARVVSGWGAALTPAPVDSSR